MLNRASVPGSRLSGALADTNAPLRRKHVGIARETLGDSAFRDGRAQRDDSGGSDARSVKRACVSGTTQRGGYRTNVKRLAPCSLTRLKRVRERTSAAGIVGFSSMARESRGPYSQFRNLSFSRLLLFPNRDVPSLALEMAPSKSRARLTRSPPGHHGGRDARGGSHVCMGNQERGGGMGGGYLR